MSVIFERYNAWYCHFDHAKICNCTAPENEDADSPRERAGRGDFSACSSGRWYLRLLLKARRAWLPISEYLAAALGNPRGFVCGWCHRPNFHFDDCGWFSINPYGAWEHGHWTGEWRVTCKKCYDGPLGRAHIERYGLGER